MSTGKKVSAEGESNLDEPQKANMRPPVRYSAWGIPLVWKPNPTVAGTGG